MDWVALGAGLISPYAGHAIAQSINDLDDVVQKTQSYPLQTSRAADADLDALQQRDSDAQYQKDAVTNGSFVAGLSRLGREALTSTSRILSDPAVLSDTVAQGVGSILAGGPVSKLGEGAGLIARAVGERFAPKAATAIGEAASSVAAKLPEWATPAAGAGTVAALEGERCLPADGHRCLRTS